MADISFQASRTSTNQLDTVAVPDTLAAMLDAIAANTFQLDGVTPVYTDALNVVYADIINFLVPRWLTAYTGIQTKTAVQSIQTAAIAAIGSLSPTFAPLVPGQPVSAGRLKQQEVKPAP